MRRLSLLLLQRTTFPKVTSGLKVRVKPERQRGSQHSDPSNGTIKQKAEPLWVRLPATP